MQLVRKCYTFLQGPHLIWSYRLTSHRYYSARGSWGSSVSIVTMLRAGRSRVWSAAGAIDLFPKKPTPVRSPPILLISVLGALSPVVKWPWRKAYYLHPSSSELNEWRCTSVAPLSFCGVASGNFTLSLFRHMCRQSVINGPSADSCEIK